MDGLSLDRRSERGRRFAREMIAAASLVDTWKQARLGPVGLSVAIRTADPLAEFVLGAFLPASVDTAPVFRLSVVRHGELRKLPSTEWARPWTDSGLPVPAVLTYPYRVFLDRLVGLAYVFDPTSGQAVVWIRRERELDLRSFLTPFRVLLSWMANTIDGEVVHASAAVVDGRGLLVSGSSGSGKSTLAIGLGLSGNQLISDDCVLLHGGRAFAVFARAKLDEGASDLIGAGVLPLRTLPRTPRAKRFLEVADLGDGFAPDHRLDVLGLAAIHPRPGHYRMSQRRAYQMMSTDSMREVFGGSTRNRLRLARLARTYPAHRLLLGPSLAENVEVVREAMRDDLWPEPADREAQECR